MPDAAQVRVRLVAGIEYIDIQANPYDILSGVTRIGSIVDSKMHEYRPTEQAWTYPLHKAAANPVGSYHDIKRLAVKGSSPTVSQYAEIAPSMFSGTMCKVAQILLGYGKVPNSPYNNDGLKLRYSFSWETTHGCVMSEGKWWLVEISRSRGVLAMRLPVIRGTGNLKSSPQDVLRTAVETFGGLPSGALFPTGLTLAVALSNGTVKQLLPPSGMTPYYECSAFDAQLGWSFNDDGTSVYNTAYKVQATPVKVFSYLFRLRFNIAVGIATLTTEETGELTAKTAGGGGIPFMFAGAYPPQKLFGDVEADYTSNAPLHVVHINNVKEVIRVKVTPNYDPSLTRLVPSTGFLGWPAHVVRYSLISTYARVVYSSTYATMDGTYSVKAVYDKTGTGSGPFGEGGRDAPVEYYNRIRIQPGTFGEVFFWERGERDCYGYLEHTEFTSWYLDKDAFWHEFESSGSLRLESIEAFERWTGLDYYEYFDNGGVGYTILQTGFDTAIATENSRGDYGPKFTLYYSDGTTFFSDDVAGVRPYGYATEIVQGRTTGSRNGPNRQRWFGTSGGMHNEGTLLDETVTPPEAFHSFIGYI